MRYGILGGSFDPIHLGHVAAAGAARAARGLLSVLLIPAGQAPHKRACVASFADRLEMARIAVRACEGLEVLDVEGVRGGISYTVDTLAELRRLRPGAEFELLVGADMLEDLPTWRRAEEVVKGALVVAFGRPGAASETARRRFDQAFGPGRHVWLDFAPLSASSTEIRRRLAGGELLGCLLDPAVEAYIRTRGLYGAGPRTPSGFRRLGG
ncbi:MAG TPA: nicotinate (nicotinamide) nucleotide adenylyltransferase [Planctomycetota bacterium]|nr:nicotinate (nicotinamide) nucleotide adenylyltransferase [Planctomycetota bacterium]